MSVSDPQLRIAQLESELKWAHLKIQVLEEKLRQQRIRMLGPQSETLSNLQLELLADEEPSATSDEVAAEAVDMRKGFEGLYGLVRDHLGQEPLSGHLFLFTNRTRTRLKALVWDGSGLWVCAKRLERGRFGWPAGDGTRSVTMRPEELAMLLNGLDLSQALPRKNWMRRAPAA